MRRGVLFTSIAVLLVYACSEPPRTYTIPPQAPSHLTQPAIEPADDEPEARSSTPTVPARRETTAEREKTYVVAVLADLNSSYGSTTYLPDVHMAVDWLVEELRPDLVLSAGDMVAGQRAGLDHGAMWKAFHSAVTRPLAEAGIPFAISPGNHDASAAGAYDAERAKFAEEWFDRRPAVEMVDDGRFPFRYAFVSGPIFVISLDATTVGPLDAAQRAWVADMLDRAGDRPTVVVAHVPLVPFTHGREHEVLDDPKLEQLLAAHGIDLFVSGHHHGYYPGHRNGIHMVSAASLGTGARPIIGTDTPSPRGVTILRLHPDGELDVEAYVSPDFDRVIDHSALPPRIEHDDYVIARAPAVASASERP